MYKDLMYLKYVFFSIKDKKLLKKCKKLGSKLNTILIKNFIANQSAIKNI